MAGLGKEWFSLNVDEELATEAIVFLLDPVHKEVRSRESAESKAPHRLQK